MKVLVCGSRSRTDYDTMMAVHRRLKRLPKGSEVLNGGAGGPDVFALRSAHDFGLITRTFLADWKTHGKRAGIVRNLQMLDEQPDLVIAFWDGKSRGTEHTITEARNRGIPVEVHSPKEASNV